MGVVDAKTLAAAKKYTDTEVAGGGAIRGKNCTIDSTTPIPGGTRITFKWTLDNGTVQTTSIDVMNGQDGNDGAPGAQGPQGPAGATGATGVGVQSVEVNAQNHLIITYTNGDIEDAGVIHGGGGESYFKDLLDTDFSNLKTGDVPVYDETSETWKNDNTIKLDIEHLKASDLSLRLAIEHLNASMATKVDKEAGKGLSSNDFTTEEKTKLGKLQPVYMIGSGLNLDSEGKLTASGIEVPIDTELDETSPNPVQNQAIAIPVHALQASMANKANKTEIPDKLSQLTNDSNYVQDANYVHTDNNYTSGDKAVVTQVPLDVTALQGSVLAIQLDITQLQASLLTKAEKSNTYTKAEVDTIAAAIKNSRFEVVTVLPTTDIKTNVIYLVPKSTAFSNNVYDEYINLDGTTAGWELIGDTEIDLSGYAKTADVNTALATKVDKVEGKGLSTKDYTAADQTAVQMTIPASISALQGSFGNLKLDVDQLQGSVVGIKLDINHLQASMATKANESELDEWSSKAYADANGVVVFDNLDDGYAYRFFAKDIFPKISNATVGTGTTTGTVKLTYHTDLPNNTECCLRMIKKD